MSTDVATTGPDDDVPDRSVGTPEERRAARRKRDAAIRKAYRDGGLDVLEEFIPGILASIGRQQELLPKVFDLVEQCIDASDTSALKDIAPMVKLLVDENKRLLDRRFGTSVQRAQVETNVTVKHVSLRDLMNARREQAAEAASAADQTANQDDVVVDATVIEDDPA